MQGAERREVVQATPAEGVANRAARPGVQMRYAKTPMAAAEVGRGAATLAMLAEKAQPAVQALHMQTMREDYLKGQMQFSQGNTYQQIRESGASYATVSGAAALQAQKSMNDAYIEGLSAIDKEDHRLTPEQYSAKLGDMSKSLFTGDKIVDDFMTELVTPNVQKLAGAQVKAHEEWKVQETKSAQRDVFLSLSKMQDEESDKTLTNMLGVKQGEEYVYDGPIQGLNPADRKETILESTVLALKQGDAKIFQKLGGMQGIRERFSTTAAEESAVLSAVTELAEKQENEWSEGLWKDNFANVRAVREGAITPEQGLDNAQAIVQKWGKGNKTMKALAENVWGAGNAYMNKVEARAQSQYDKHLRDLERAQVKAEEARELQMTSAYAVATGTVPLLDTKGQKEAIRQIQTNVLATVEAGIADGSIPAGVDKEMALATAYAAELDKHGIVDDGSAALWTASMSRMNAVVDGKVTESSMAAFKHLVALNKVNPGLALQHLKSESAKNFFKMALDLEEFGETTEGAIMKASMAAKAEVTPQQLASRVGTVEFKKQLQVDLESEIKDTLPTLFFGANRGSMSEVTQEEVARAATSPAVMNRLSRAVAVKITSDPGLTDAQARSLVLQDEMQRGAYILGSWLTPKSGTLYDAMGLQGYKSETGVPMEAMTNYLAEKGPELFGRDWFNKDIFVPGHDLSTTAKGWYDMTKDQITRSVPKVHMSMGTDADGTFFVVSPILTTGLPTNAHMVIRAKDVGKHYKEQRLKEDTDQGFISEAYGTVVRGAHSFGTAPVSPKGGGPMTKAIRDALGLTNKE